MKRVPKSKTVSIPNTPADGKRLTPESRENQLIALAYDLVEQRLRDGTATSQETTHFLKMGSPKAKLEKQILEEDAKLRRAKTEALESQKRTEELIKDGFAALLRYQGHRDEENKYYD